ncbi:MAG: DUF2946 family protein [Hyphomicrobium sp.]
MLVIAALMASPIARTFCRAVVGSATAGVQLVAPCHHEGMAGKLDSRPGSDKSHDRSDHCPVCMALAAVAMADSAIHVWNRQWADPVGGGIPKVPGSEPLKLNLGGIGSRAPPLKA